MRRPRTSTPLDTPRGGPWLDPKPPIGGVDGGGGIGGGYLQRRRASPIAEGARGRWHTAGRAAGSTTPRGTAGTTGGGTTTVVGAAKTMLYQLVLWPLTLCIMLVSSAYRFTLRVGCYSSPLRFREPPRWLIRLITKPCRLINPPVSFGADNLKGCVGGGCASVAAAGKRQGGGANGGTANGGPAGGGDATAIAAGAPTAAAGGTVPSPPRPVLLVGNQSLLGLDSLAVLNEVRVKERAAPLALLRGYCLFGLLGTKSDNNKADLYVQRFTSNALVVATVTHETTTATSQTLL